MLRPACSDLNYRVYGLTSDIMPAYIRDDSISRARARERIIDDVRSRIELVSLEDRAQWVEIGIEQRLAWAGGWLVYKVRKVTDSNVLIDMVMAIPPDGW